MPDRSTQAAPATQDRGLPIFTGIRGDDFRSKPFDEEADDNPMANITNMVDAMLVLALGMMLALVTVLQVDLSRFQELFDEDLQQVDNVEEMVDQITSTSNPYQEMGKVYQDPSTGKLYMLQEVEDDGDGSDGGASDSSSGRSSSGTGASNAGGSGGGGNQTGSSSAGE